MKQSIKFLLSYYLSVLALFLLVQKPLFILMNRERWHYGPAEFWQVYAHGFRLDLAAASYVTAFAWLLLGLWFCIPRFPLRRSMRVCNAVIGFLLALATLADGSLYEFWEFKLDATVLMYVGDPKNAMASVSAGYVLVRLLALSALSVLFWWLLGLPLRVLGGDRARRGPWYGRLVVALAAAGCLFLGARGTRVWPNTPSVAYFTNDNFLNHSAVNPLFNFVYTATKFEDFSHQMRYFPEQERAEIYAPLYNTESKDTERLFETRRPNVLFIVLEGYGACFIEALGGEKGISPALSRLADESVCFTNCYCSSIRTDRGIVAALSGYPAQPTTSIMRYTQKMHTLPGLPKSLKRAGYDTQVLYAGDMSFFNMSDYFVSAGHDRLISEADFPLSARSGKWGVPDGVAFDWLYDDLVRRQQHSVRPHYTTFLTLSSHQPFDVPYHRFGDKMLNAFAYTDHCLGGFLDRLRKTAAWDNLLIVISADHGCRYHALTAPSFPHIPLMMTGGVIRKYRKIDRLVDQTDIPATLLAQLGLPHADYAYSRDVLSATYRYPFTMNTFNNGFNFRDSTGCTVFDNVTKKAISGADKARERKGKAILQTLYDDLSKR